MAQSSNSHPLATERPNEHHLESSEAWQPCGLFGVQPRQDRMSSRQHAHMRCQKRLLDSKKYILCGLCGLPCPSHHTQQESLHHHRFHLQAIPTHDIRCNPSGSSALPESSSRRGKVAFPNQNYFYFLS